MNTPRPEHPRPLLERKDWLNLNGEWQFAFDDDDKGIEKQYPVAKSLDKTIVVPFAYQTAASTVNDKAIHEIVWYCREFTVPAGWSDRNVLLHFGAVDYLSTVWVNGNELGKNVGGQVPFSFDITPFLQAGDNRITVRVEDRQDPEQPRGKQSLSGIPHDIDYYCTTGIWQTVWLESVPTMRIDDVRIFPSAKEQKFYITAILHAPSTNWKVEVDLLDDGELVHTITVEDYKSVIDIEVPVPYATLWSPDNPKLYTFKLRLYQGDKLHDEVSSYGGLRDFSIHKDTLVLNGKPVYLAMVLDQGYWPESGMTAGTDEELKADVEWIKQYGYNGVRKHQKVEDPRWLYWCDKLGLLVWGEMANARDWSHSAEERLLNEWTRVIRRDLSHPCIVAWVPLNESWGVPDLKDQHQLQYAYVERTVTITRQIDPSRPVIDNDGWEHTDIGDICAIHDYTPTAESLRERYKDTLLRGVLPEKVWANNLSLFANKSQYHGQPVVLSEVGGFLMIPENHGGELDMLYSAYGNSKSNDEMLGQYADLSEGLIDLTFISGFCYTQLTDIEQEANGLLTYDRKPKVPVDKIAAYNKSIIDAFNARNKGQLIRG
ncbi:MAG TPA: glycoside hydrolase family 2 TIM barrel-domain containing protein [Candidatus Saccharimonadales bacterium]